MGKSFIEAYNESIRNQPNADGKYTYQTDGIDYVSIDGNRFDNYGQYSFLWEKTYVKSPTRSSNGAIRNLNSYATFLTPHLILDFSVMSIDDYRKIMQMHYSANEFIVNCYDPIYDRRITVKMYFGTEQIAKLHTISQLRLSKNGEWENWIDLVGVRDYKVELIGTNNDFDYINVTYEYGDYESPSGSPIQNYIQEVYQGEEIVVGEGVYFVDTPPTGYKFEHWIDSKGTVYTQGKAVTVNEPLILKAVWETSTSKTLSYNYGLSEPDTKINENGELVQILNKTITDTSSIGELPRFDPSPKETYNGEQYEPYHKGAWYKTPSRQADMIVTANSPYWSSVDTIIYLLYEKIPFDVVYHTNIDDITFPAQKLTYGDSVYFPNIVKEGYSLEGWYLDAEFSTKFSGKMPPFSINLYARWIAK